MLKRRYEILLPLKHNDGRDVSDDAFNLTRRELVERFDGVSFQPQPVQGLWADEGQEYDDVLVRLTVDVEDTPQKPAVFYRLQKCIAETV
jgi:hypothetical protein